MKLMNLFTLKLSWALLLFAILDLVCVGLGLSQRQLFETTHNTQPGNRGRGLPEKLAPMEILLHVCLPYLLNAER